MLSTAHFKICGSNTLPLRSTTSKVFLKISKNDERNPTVGFPWRLISICAKEQMSPTPTTSTVKFLKKSMISKDLFLRRKMRINGVTIGLSNASKMNTWLGEMKKNVFFSNLTLINVFLSLKIFHASPLCTGTAVPPHRGSHSCWRCLSSDRACSECAPACTAAAVLDTTPYAHLG